jgi:hypothetical protein
VTRAPHGGRWRPEHERPRMNDTHRTLENRPTADDPTGANRKGGHRAGGGRNRHGPAGGPLLRLRRRRHAGPYRNNELKEAGDPARIENLAAVREHFLTPWVAWNIVRTLASTAAFGSLVWALALRGRTRRLPD